MMDESQLAAVEAATAEGPTSLLPPPQPSDEPTDAEAARLDAAISAVPSVVDKIAMRVAVRFSPDRPGRCRCCRCGYRWNPQRPDPRCCPNCKSSYWNREPVRSDARRPENTDWEAEQRKANDLKSAKKRYYEIRRAKKLARKLGLALVDPATGAQLAKPRRRPESGTDSTPATQPPPIPITLSEALRLARVDRIPAPTPTVAPPRPLRTVPPPPGSEELESRR